MWREIVRVATIALLLLAFADLAFPQICGEESGPLFPTRSATSDFAQAGESGEPHPGPRRAEDCFCCCSHIVAEDARSPLDQLSLVSDSDRTAAPTVPTAPVRILFRPPRLA